ncbi:phosphotransferase [Ferrimonas pelagia]|uniref:Aminoglycoside phosphotransferase domain-containing protein n=1 Tax=Ferrimonas pelagia TaxID=1177826 RepID=A0ABP9EH46_9GAMM
MRDKQLTALLCQAGFSERPWRFTAIAGASSNRLYRVEHDAMTLVLRLHTQANDFAVERAREHQAWLAGSKAGLAPKLLYWSEDHRFCLSEYGGESPTSLSVEPLLALILALHRLPMLSPRFDYGGRIRTYLKGVSDPELHAFTALIPVWEEALQASALPWGFCHHDLHPGNILHHQGQWRAVDFEYAGCGHPLMDLAVAQEALPIAERPVLWRDYLRANGLSPDPTERAAWQAAQKLQALMTVCWAAQMGLQGIDTQSWIPQAMATLMG